MKTPRALALLFTASALALAASVRAQSPGDIKGIAPVSVSSANYRDTPYDELSRQVNSKNAINPAPRELKPLAEPKYFVFIAGEIFSSDVTYEMLCRHLAPELAKKGYLNAADEKGRIFKPEAVTLMLRVNFGVSMWRNPVVRTEHITWKEGLVGEVHDPRSLTHNGGTRAWDERAGGNDFALNTVMQNNASTGTGADARPTTSDVSAGSYVNTREFNLIVVDAFDYAELKKKGKYAKTLWTTFIAAPVEHGQKFSQIMPTMIRSAAGYWGETTSGVQVFTDARAEVRIGDVVEVKDAPVKK
jgi:hypothetical protein